MGRLAVFSELPGEPQCWKTTNSKNVPEKSFLNELGLNVSSPFRGLETVDRARAPAVLAPFSNSTWP